MISFLSFKLASTEIISTEKPQLKHEIKNDTIVLNYVLPLKLFMFCWQLCRKMIPAGSNCQHPFCSKNWLNMSKLNFFTQPLLFTDVSSSYPLLLKTIHKRAEWSVSTRTSWSIAHLGAASVTKSMRVTLQFVEWLMTIILQ